MPSYSETERSEALALLRSGLSPEAAAERLARQGLTVTARTVRRWGVAARSAPAKVAPAVSAPAKPAARQPEAVAETPAELEEEAAEILDAADRAHDRLDALHAKLTTRVEQELALPIPNMKALTDVSKLMLEVAVTLNKTRPPLALKPEDDPTNIAAAEQLLERVEKLVAARERKAA
ncbi:MAG TPA: hypothetical protein VIU64_19540 [Polyangia bacterium]